MLAIRLRESIPLLLVAAVAACSSDPTISGQPPQGATTEIGQGGVQPGRAGAAARNAANPAGGSVERPDAAKAVIGVATTRMFHRPACAAAAGVPNAELVRFMSPWDAVDGQYQPCPQCRPGP